MTLYGYIKKIIMDYTNKQIDKTSTSTDEQSLVEVMNKLLASEKLEDSKKKEPISDAAQDEEIDKILDETERG